MGKSTTAAMFADAGVPVWDADACVHKMYSKGGQAVDLIENLSPESIVNGEVDRAALSSWLAGRSDRFNALESAVHPLVAKDREDFISASHSDVLVFDIPLLFETMADEWLDAVVVVTTDAQTQRARVLDRPGMTDEKFEQILGKQLPDTEKRKRADYLVTTDTLAGAEKAVKYIIQDIRGKLNA